MGGSAGGGPRVPSVTGHGSCAGLGLGSQWQVGACGAASSHVSRGLPTAVAALSLLRQSPQAPPVLVPGRLPATSDLWLESAKDDEDGAGPPRNGDLIRGARASPALPPASGGSLPTCLSLCVSVPLSVSHLFLPPPLKLRLQVHLVEGVTLSDAMSFLGL